MDAPSAAALAAGGDDAKYVLLFGSQAKVWAVSSVPALASAVVAPASSSSLASSASTAAAG